MLSNKEIKTKYEHNDVEQEKFFKSYHNIYNIYTIYSPDIETGEMKFSLQMKTIYSYLLSWQENGLTCYQNQEDLAKMCDMSRQRFVEMTSKMQKAGILKKEKIEGRRNKELIALPITDSHLNPPESIHASPVEDVKPISNAIPQVVIEEPAQGDTEALSDNVKECPFFTTSEEAYQDELEFDSLPVATTHTKRVNSDMEPLSNIFINYLSEGGRLTNESFAEFARRVFEDTDNKYPAGFEIYFSKAYPKIYEEFELPF
ncbi:helix-turn-helix domain-containing protein [Klebsiella variicola]|uniref:helix-turn-helix domain-containing protein n=1 Tax=Klebsiella variicola TaxID=244366 RepID=UPI00190F072A|nr:helix-turn-helix domain-containing protein [Klebsiella variicola]